MATRRPLVVINGKVQELSSSDSLLGALASQDVTSIAAVTQAEYDALSPPDPNTLYLIEGPASPVSSTGLTGIEIVTQAQYDALSPPNPATAYLISDAAPSGGGGVSQEAFDELLAEIITARGTRSQIGMRIETISNFASPNAGGVIPGQYYDNSFHSMNANTISAVANSLILCPYYTSAPLRIDRIGLAVSTVSATEARVGIYLSGPDGWPSELEYQGGTPLDISTSGYKGHILDFIFDSGRQYWLGVHFNNTGGSIRAVNVNSCVNLGLRSPTSANYFTHIRGATTFAEGFPATWTFNASELINGVVPSIRMRASTL